MAAKVTRWRPNARIWLGLAAAFQPGLPGVRLPLTMRQALAAAVDQPNFCKAATPGVNDTPAGWPRSIRMGFRRDNSEAIQRDRAEVDWQYIRQANVSDIFVDAVLHLFRLRKLVVRDTYGFINIDVRDLRYLEYLEFNRAGTVRNISGLGCLSRLRKLVIRYSILLQLPAGVTDIAGLIELDLMNSHLRSLPDDIGRLRNLKTLNLRFNWLYRLPPSMRDLTSLRDLDLYGNNLREDGLHAPAGLKVLDLTANKITVLPDCVREMTRLDTLVCEDCDLQTLPDWIGELTELTCLNFKRNQLRGCTLPDSLFGLPRLRSLDLSLNVIEHLSDKVVGLQELAYLYLSDSHMVCLPTAILRLPKLAHVHCLGHRFGSWFDISLQLVLRGVHVVD